MPLPKINSPLAPRQSSKDIVYSHLKQWIIDGTLTPGEKINDSEIAAYFSVSRTPVREAILLLESHQLVDITPSKGTTVSHFNMDKIYVLYEAIISIHLSVLELAFPKIDDSTILSLQEINERFISYAHSNNLDLIRKTDEEFHQVFFELANNSYLSSFHEQLLIHTTRLENIYFRSEHKVENSYAVHNNIIQYLIEKNLTRAKQELSLNWLNTLELENTN